MELFNITIPAGKTTASFNIIITANNTLKDNRTFYLMIIEDSLHKNIILGENNIAKIVVVNNDNLDEVSSEYTTYVHMCVYVYVYVLMLKGRVPCKKKVFNSSTIEW